jgi:glycosyltransferase involved in cell wall biosynthesis
MAERADLRFIVLQPGARMHYAVPALLARAGMLKRLYTDICADVGVVRHLQPLWPDRLRPKPIARLLGRRLPREVAPGLVRQVPVRAMADRLLQGSAAARRLNGWLNPTEAILNLVRKDNFAGANAIYTVLINADLELVRDARSRGMTVIHEAITPPHIGRLLRQEEKLFAGHESKANENLIDSGNRLDALKYQSVDLIIAPSDFVRAAILSYGADPRRVITVPYGLNERWFEHTAHPAPGRVLFVGNVGLGKGSHYLAEAARILQRRRMACEVRVVGPRCRKMISHPAFRGPHYVGHVPRTRVIDEFLRADVFVLPTLCEGMARAHLEAMACGVPVVTTPNCGSVVRDGIDGFIVPIRDAEAVADRIELLVTDRQLRARLGRNARERAREFTWERYGERLFAAFGRLQH